MSVEPSLTLSLSASSLALNLDPSITTFGYKDLDVIVGTNNATGYKLTMSTTSGDTNLVNTEDNTKVIETLPTLAGGYTDSTFIVNKWGYKKNRNTDNYNSFPATQTLLENDERTNQDIANLRFGTKIDYLQESGTYATELQFTVTANPVCDTTISGIMQTFAPCPDMADGIIGTLTDIRDGQEYTIAKINGNYWMTKNLRFGYNASNPNTTTITLEPNTSNVTTAKSVTFYDALTYGSNYCYGNGTITTSFDYACVHSNSNTGIWYNYNAATAGTISGLNTAKAIEDVCPANWRLPTHAEATTLSSYKSNFNVLAGGYALRGAISETNRGWWWTSEDDGQSNSHTRYSIEYNSTNETFNTSYQGLARYAGVYIRCVLK